MDQPPVSELPPAAEDDGGEPSSATVVLALLLTFTASSCFHQKQQVKKPQTLKTLSVNECKMEGIQKKEIRNNTAKPG